MRIRFIFLPTLLLFLAAPHAHAAPSAVCAQVKNLPAVSTHYVAKVLTRADAGIAHALTSPANDDFDRYRPLWALSVTSGWAELIDSRITRTYEEQELGQVTACMQFDTLLLDCKMDDVREELRKQIDRGSWNSIRILLSLLSFLQERKRHLTLGGLDPLYSDSGWGEKYIFDPPEQIWCCPEGNPENTCEQLSEQACDATGGMSFTTRNECGNVCAIDNTTPPPADDVLCPFDADYAPPFQSGFGCDVETMQSRSAYPPLNAEFEALKIINEEVKKYQSSSLELLDIQRQIDSLFDNTTTSPTPPANRQHINAYGCGWNQGYCNDDEQRACFSNADCERGIACRIPEKVCKGNRVIRCERDDQCGNNGPCIENKDLPAVRELRGPFSFSKDQIAILSDFLGVRAAQEFSRDFREDLKTANEFKAEQEEEQSLRAFEDSNPFTRFFRSAGRIQTQLWSRLQARKEALIYPEAVDAPLEIAESLKTLRTTVSTLSTLASSKDGVRQFVSRYAYFINRTCIYRPCSLMLERVIRIVTTDECFPYTNGAYLNDDENNTRRKKCEEAAGIK